VDVVDVDGRVEEDETDKKNKKDNKTDKGGGGGGSSGIFGFFSNNTTTTTTEAVTFTTAISNGNTDDDSNNNASTSSTTTTTTCPYPKPFIEKRQKELGSYWINLSRVEDIFEFSDIHSHRFGTLMASFLEVDQILLTRRNTNSRASAAAAPFSAGEAASSSSSLQQERYHHHHHAPISPSRLTAVVPVIHENETELFSFGARKSEQWQSPLTTSREFSDDVSMLSDGTGANAYLTGLQNNHNSPVHAANARRRLLVDNVPAHFTSNHPLPLIATENRSVSSKSTRRVGGRGASRGIKPAFQRQFIE
jgi:hypothetical protein